MTGTSAQEPTPVGGTHLALYDGVCGLCNKLVRFLLEHDRHAVFMLASLQSATGTALVKRFGGRPDELSTFYVVTDYRTAAARMLGRSDAALFVAGQLGWPWKAAAPLRMLPRAVRDGAYDLVARNRYRVFGRLDQCLVPPPESRHRFIDD
jgi:predicted DCC family thiol-disulfide oxidoreductase YuxK